MDASTAVESILTHFGTKGMKWGVRKERSSAVTVTSKGKKLKTSGGHGRPAHPDAVRVRKIGQVGKKSGLKALSDKDLQDYQKRLNLEANVKRLQYNEKNAAKRFVASILGQSGKNAVQTAANEAASRQIKKHVFKTAAAAAL